MFKGSYREAKDVGENPIFKYSKYAAGIAIAAYGAKKKLGLSFSDTALAEPIQDFLSSTLRLIDPKKVYGGLTSLGLAETLIHSGSSSMSLSLNGESDILSQIVSSVNHAGREQRLFNMVGSMLTDSNPLNSATSKNQITSIFREYTRANTPSEAKKSVTSDLVNKLITIIGKDNFKSGFNSPIDVLNSLHSGIERGHFSVNRDAVSQRLNFKDIDRALEKTIAKENERVVAHAKKLFGKDAEALTLKDLLDSPDGSKFLKDLGFFSDIDQNINEKSISDHIAQMTQKTLKGKKISDSEMIREVIKRKERALNAQTGFVRTKHGIVPMSMLEKRGKESLFKTLNRLQVPLFPGVMNVPLTILNFNSSDSKVVRGLGKISKQADLLRIMPNLERSNYGIAVGESLLELNPKTLRASLTEEANIGVIGLSHNTKARSLVESRGMESIFTSFKEFFKGGDRGRVSKIYEAAVNHPDKFFEIGYHPNTGFTLQPKNDKVALVFDYLRKQGDYDYKAINPKQLLNFILNNPEEIKKIDPQHLNEALFHILHSSQDTSKSHSSLIKSFISSKLNGGSDTLQAATELLSAIEQSPEKALGTAETLENFLLESGSTDIYRVAQRVKSHPHELNLSVSEQDSGGISDFTGTITGIKKGLIGDPSHSALHLEAEKAVQKEIIRDISESQFVENSKLTRSRVLELASKHVSLGTSYLEDPMLEDALVEEYKKIGVNTAEEIMSMSFSLLRPGSVKTGTPELNVSSFRRFTTAFLDPQEVLGGTALDLPIFKNAMEDATSLTGSKDFLERQSLKFLSTLAGSTGSSVTSQVTGKSFSPFILGDNQFDDIPNYAIAAGFNLFEGLKGLISPSTALNEFSYRATVMARSANNVLGEVGLGVNNASLGSVGSTMTAFGLTRVLPVVAGFYAWGALNNSLDSSGLPSLPEVAAGVLGPLSLGKSLIQEVTGLNDISKRIVDAVPGLDQYFTPRSFEEQQDYLAFGEDPIRTNRLWILGNRSPVSGSSIEGFRPNFYNRWRSNWTNASNVLAFNPFIDWVDKVQDRPYKLSKSSPRGGGEEGSGAENGYGTGGSGGGSGSQGHGLILGEGGGHSGSMDQILQGPSEIPSITDLTRRYRAVSGFYGAFLRYNFAFQPDKIDLQVQDPDFATGIGRMMFLGRYGELTGPVGEFTRRFVSGDIQATDAINPLPNTMPEWLPDDMLKGDPYCVSPETLLITREGLKKAENIEVGEKVLTHQGNFEKVFSIFLRSLEKMEVAKKITVFGMPSFPLTASPGHPLYQYKDGDYVWTEVKDIKIGDTLAYPRKKSTQQAVIIDLLNYVSCDYFNDNIYIPSSATKPSDDYKRLLGDVIEGRDTSWYKKSNNSARNSEIKAAKRRCELHSQNRFVEVDEDLCYVLGWVLAEGTFQNAQVDLSMNISESNYAEKIIKIIKNKFPKTSSSWKRLGNTEGASLHLYSLPVQRLFESLVGKISHHKKLSDIFFNLKNSCIDALLEGYFLGDGCSFISKGRYVVSAKTCNRNLSYQIWELLLLRGYVSSIITNSPRVSQIGQKQIRSSRSYTIKLGSSHAYRFMREILGASNIKPPKPYRYSNYYLTKDFLHVKVVKIGLDPSVTKVYGFSVENDASFCTPSIATHNSRSGPIGELELPGEAYERSHPALALDQKLSGRNRYQSYDEVSKLEILARVAPNSYKYSEQLRRAMSQSLTPQGFKRVQLAREDAEDKEEMYHLYPRRNVGTDSFSARVENIGLDGEIYTDRGVFRLAGVKFSYDAYSEGYERVLETFGIAVGANVQVKIVEGQEGILGETVIPAIINGVNQEIVKSHYASYDRKDKSPLAYKMMYGTSWFEEFSHLDTPINNKLLRARSPLEQFERGEVYGTDKFDWMHPLKTGLYPTITSYIHRDMVGAALGAMLTTSFFLRRSEDKVKAGKVAGAIVAGLAFLNGLDGNPLPESYYRDSEVDEYLDTIKYVKYSRINSAVDEELKKSASSATIESLQKLKKFAEKKISQTMIGYDEEINSLDDAIRSLPRRQQQIAKEIILYANKAEKEDFYDLLPDPQKRVLASYLGFDSPKNTGIENASKKFDLPGEDWEGWSALVEDKQIETLVRANENVLAGRPGRSTVDKAKQILGDNFRVPYMENGVSSVEAILRSTPNITYEIQRLTSDRPEMTLDFDTKEEVAQYYRDKVLEQIKGPNF